MNRELAQLWTELMKPGTLPWIIKGAVYGFVLMICVIGPLVVLTVLTVLKTTDIYSLSLSAVQDSQDIQSLIGVPVKPGYFVLGSFQSIGNKGQAAMWYTVTGPRGEGKAYVTGFKEQGTWVMQELYVDIEAANRRVNIVTGQ